MCGGMLPLAASSSLEKQKGQGMTVHYHLSHWAWADWAPEHPRMSHKVFFILHTSEYEDNSKLEEVFLKSLPQVAANTNAKLERHVQLEELSAALQSIQARKARHTVQF